MPRVRQDSVGAAVAVVTGGSRIDVVDRRHLASRGLRQGVVARFQRLMRYGHDRFCGRWTLRLYGLRRERVLVGHGQDAQCPEWLAARQRAAPSRSRQPLRRRDMRKPARFNPLVKRRFLERFSSARTSFIADAEGDVASMAFCNRLCNSMMSGLLC